jgi:hypothetical protein
VSLGQARFISAVLVDHVYVVRSSPRRTAQIGYLLSIGRPGRTYSLLEAVLKSYPDQDIHLLAMARRRESSEEGHEALTEAMRALL